LALNPTGGGGGRGVYHFTDKYLGVHTLRNQTSAVAMSLHVYTPAMLTCCGNPVVYCQRSYVPAPLAAARGQPLFTNFRAMVCL
jgi:hypothetical protein